MPIAEKFQKLRETKEALRIIADATVEEPFSSYPTKIQEKMNSGGSINESDFFTDTLVTGTAAYLITKLLKKTPSNIVELINSTYLTNLSSAFNACTYLEKINLNGLNTSNMTAFENTFSSCSNLNEINLSGWDTTNVTKYNYMFSGCASIQEIDISSFDTSGGINFIAMFSNCNKLKKINGVLNIINNGASYSVGGIFNNCNDLEEVYVKNLNMSGLRLNYSPKLKKECIVYLLENAVTTTGTRTITLGSTNLAKLTAEEIAVGTNKGYTIS